MPNSQTDKSGFSTSNNDEERDMAAKGGPTTSLGQPDGKHGISHPYDEDLATQMAVKGKKKHHEKDDENKQNRP